jgi:hypothetical protein
MASVVVAILDRDDWAERTDVIVVADSSRQRLTWVPRDLWSPRLNNRVNTAFSAGGGGLLLAALAELGFPAQSVLCLRRAATEAALEGLTITVPVTKPLDFWYPLHPARPIEEGRKAISFRPPEERLTGERLHQWIGARTEIERSGSDLRRLRRQQVLLRAMLAGGFDFRRALANPALVRATGPDPMTVLSMIRADWKMVVFDAVQNATIDGKAVLVPRKPVSFWRRMRRRLRAALRRPFGSR